MLNHFFDGSKRKQTNDIFVDGIPYYYYTTTYAVSYSKRGPGPGQKEPVPEP